VFVTVGHRPSARALVASTSSSVTLEEDTHYPWDPVLSSHYQENLQFTWKMKGTGRAGDSKKGKGGHHLFFLVWRPMLGSVMGDQSVLHREDLTEREQKPDL
jgi:hypothetical protein